MNGVKLLAFSKKSADAKGDKRQVGLQEIMYITLPDGSLLVMIFLSQLITTKQPLKKN